MTFAYQLLFTNTDSFYNLLWLPAPYWFGRCDRLRQKSWSPSSVSCVASRKIVRFCLGARPRYSLVVDEDVKEPYKQTNNKFYILDTIFILLFQHRASGSKKILSVLDEPFHHPRPHCHSLHLHRQPLTPAARLTPHLLRREGATLLPCSDLQRMTQLMMMMRMKRRRKMMKKTTMNI